MRKPESTVHSEFTRSLAAALRFFRFDRTAVEGFDPTPPAALRSFWAALYGLPFYVGVLALDVWRAPTPPGDLWLYALVQAIGYIAHTAAFPLAVLGLSRFLGHVEQWPLFVTAQNWLGLPQIVLLLAAVIVESSGILGPAGALVLVAVQLYSLAVESFVTQAALRVNALAAVAIVLLDIVISVAVDQVASGLL